MLRSPLGVVFILSIIGSSPAWSQTLPLLTEEATTAPAGRVALETAVEVMGAEPNFQTSQERTRFDGPLARLVYSPADNVELDVEWVTRVGVFGDPDFGSLSAPGDITLRSKVRLRGPGPSGTRTAWGARFSVTLPQTPFGRGLGPNTVRLSVQALVTRPFSRRLRVHANIGLGLADEVFRPHQQRDLIAYGGAGEWDMAGRLSLLAEVAGLAGDGRPGTDTRSEVRAGGRWAWRTLHADAAVRRGLGKAAGAWGMTLGLLWTISSSN